MIEVASLCVVTHLSFRSINTLAYIDRIMHFFGLFSKSARKVRIRYQYKISKNISLAISRSNNKVLEEDQFWKKHSFKFALPSLNTSYHLNIGWKERQLNATFETVEHESPYRIQLRDLTNIPYL